MNLSEISIRNHVFAWMLMLGLMIFGAMGFSRMGISQLPDVDFPTVNITLNLDGAVPEVMEMDVVDIVESAITSVQGIKTISSTSRTGSATVTVEFNLDKDIDTAVQEIQTAISRSQGLLPNDIDPPIVRKTNPEDQPIMWLSVASDTMSRQELMKMVRDELQDNFTIVEGVGEVVLGGYVEPALRVWLDEKKLNRYELSPTDVIDAISLEHSELPGGRIETQQNEYNIRTLGEAPTVKDFGDLMITRRGGSLNYAPIPLRSVAITEDGTEDIRSISRSQGKISVGLGIKKQPGTNAVRVGKAVKAKIEQIRATLPKGVDIGVRFDSTTFIEDAVNELIFTLIFSAILTAIVCWAFLGSWSATLNVILAIPTSILGSFIVLHALGFTLNTFTLLGLSLAIGIVVDDAIMVLENIVRHNEMGKSRVRAALDGSKEIWLAAVAATAAIIAIFLPVVFMDGVIGKYFLQFGITLSVTVAISLLEAITLTPMRCSRFLEVKERSSLFGRTIENGFQACANLYKRIIPKTLNHPWLVVIGATLFFIGTLFFGKHLKQEFIPPEDQGRLMIRAQLPPGSSLASTNQKLLEIEKYLMTRPEVEGYFSVVGGGGGGVSQVNTGMAYVTLKPKSKRKKSAQEILLEFRKQFVSTKETRIVVQDPSLTSLGGRGGFPVQFTVKGSDWAKLAELSTTLMAEMEKTKMMTDIDTSYQEGMPEIQVIPNRAAAAEYGVDISSITQTINVTMASSIAGKFSQNGRRYDVRVGLPSDKRGSMEVLNNLFVRNNRGELIAMSKVVKIKQDSALQSILREDRQRAINLRANVATGSSQAEAIAAVKKITAEKLPPGYTSVISGTAQTFQESFRGLIIALVLGLLVSYMVLGSQFNSFIDPITILIALPFSLSGAFVALYFGHQTLNIYSMIGLILLMGIVKKNSIMLVEFTNQMKEKGMDVKEALTEACPNRLRPILMTSIATITGAIPPALAIGPGAESRVPMALAVIGGVIVSTVLTIFVVPCVYYLFDRFNKPEPKELRQPSPTK